MGRRSLASLVLATGVLLSALQATAGERGLTLDLGNGGDRALRCVMVIAHFMSEDLPTIAPGERLAVTLEHDDTDGSLFLRSGDGRRKMIENIVCGASDDWSETRGEVPLLPLRAPTSDGASVTCRIVQRLSCQVTDAGD